MGKLAQEVQDLHEFKEHRKSPSDPIGEWSGAEQIHKHQDTENDRVTSLDISVINNHIDYARYHELGDVQWENEEAN